MVLPFVPLLLAADPGARFDAFMKARPAFVATVEASVGGRTTGTGTLRLARPRQMRFDVKGAGLDYSILSTDKAYIEIDRIGKVYDERPPIGGVRVYEGRISPGQSLIPSFLIAGTAQALFGGEKPSVAAVAGGDEMRATLSGPAGTTEVRLVVDPSGKPLRFSASGPSGQRSWRVLSLGAPPDEAAFRLTAPLGFVPFTLPELAAPLAIGEDVPLTGWRKGGRPVDLNEPQRGRPRLLAVLSPDSPPSRAARPFLIELGRSMPVFLLEPGGVEDPTGALMRKLSPPGTPMFYLVGPDGTVKKLWFGFDPAKGKSWEAEVLTAAKAKE